ncbi:MAG: helix-turn-helix protein [Herbinix sp.]|jgi:transcriptional regulator with XRE-family HTH domain|nr:helix-turn-helix protein [Herbinix sp.]
MTGKEFRKWRRINELTQDEVSEQCNIDTATISRWERDKAIITEKNYKALLELMNSNVANEAYE